MAEKGPKTAIFGHFRPHFGHFRPPPLHTGFQNPGFWPFLAIFGPPEPLPEPQPEPIFGPARGPSRTRKNIKNFKFSRGLFRRLKLFSFRRRSRSKIPARLSLVVSDGDHLYQEGPAPSDVMGLFLISTRSNQATDEPSNPNWPATVILPVYKCEHCKLVVRVATCMRVSAQQVTLFKCS
jgi:hypothetical protein